jgi:hypothetical protein
MARPEAESLESGAVLVYDALRDAIAMRGRPLGVALILALGTVLAAQGQEPPGSRVVVVTGDPSTSLTA